MNRDLVSPEGAPPQVPLPSVGSPGARTVTWGDPPVSRALILNTSVGVGAAVGEGWTGSAGGQTEVS
jgi:hypothetical protein